MKVVLFGGTGGTGKNVITRALAAGHEVVAVARRPEAITTKHERLRVVKGDVLDGASIAAAVSGAEVVIAAFGPADNKKPGTLMSEGTRNIVDAAARAGVSRVVFESGLMLTDGSELSLFGRFGVSIYRAMNRALHDDKVLAEAALRGSALDWVIVRPPALDHSPATGDYKVGPAMRVNPARKLSHDDVAELLVQVAAEARWSKQVINVGH